MTSEYTHDIIKIVSEGNNMSLPVAKELKSIRIKNNINLKKVAKENKMSEETLKKYGNNKQPITLKTLEKLLKYYKADSYIFFKKICEYTHK